MRIWNPGKLLIIGSLLPTIVWAQAPIEQFASGVVQAHLAQGESGEAKLKTSIAMLAGKGGVVDARGLLGNQTITSTIEIPANTTVLLHPNVVYTCTVKDAPCWALRGNGAKLVGYHAGSNDVASASQTGTVLRMGRGVTSGTDMIQVATTPKLTQVGAIEIGGITIDFASSSSSIGRDGLGVYCMNRSWLHDVTILNAGRDGLHAETGPSCHSYENDLDRVYVRAAQRDGFRWDTSQNSSNYDFDHWHIRNSNYTGFNQRGTSSANCPSGGPRYGANGVNLIVGSSTTLQTIQDFTFTNLEITSPSCGGNGFALNAPNPVSGSTSSLINNIRLIGGEIEDVLGNNSGVGINVSSANVPNSNGAGCTTDCVKTIAMVSIDSLLCCYSTLHNVFTHSSNVGINNITSYSMRIDGVHLLSSDGIRFVAGDLPDVSTYNPTSGISWQSESSGSYLWYLTRDGIVHVARTDAGIASPRDYFLLDQGNDRFGPGADNTGSLGWPGKRWSKIDAYTMTLGGQSSTWSSGSGAPRGNCNVGSLYTNSSATSASSVLYVCYPANTWNAVNVR